MPVGVMFQVMVRSLPTPVTVVAAQLMDPWLLDNVTAVPGVQVPTLPVPALLKREIFPVARV